VANAPAATAAAASSGPWTHDISPKGWTHVNGGIVYLDGHWHSVPAPPGDPGPSAAVRNSPVLWQPDASSAAPAAARASPAGTNCLPQCSWTNSDPMFDQRSNPLGSRGISPNVVFLLPKQHFVPTVPFDSTGASSMQKYTRSAGDSPGLKSQIVDDGDPEGSPVILDPGLLWHATKEGLTKDPGVVASLGPDQISLGWHSGLNLQRLDCCSIIGVAISNDAKNLAEGYSVGRGLYSVGLDDHGIPTGAVGFGPSLGLPTPIGVSHASQSYPDATPIVPTSPSTFLAPGTNAGLPTEPTVISGTSPSTGNVPDTSMPQVAAPTLTPPPVLQLPSQQPPQATPSVGVGPTPSTSNASATYSAPQATPSVGVGPTPSTSNASATYSAPQATPSVGVGPTPSTSNASATYSPSQAAPSVSQGTSSSTNRASDTYPSAPMPQYPAPHPSNNLAPGTYAPPEVAPTVNQGPASSTGNATGTSGATR
jgi:hypothetical protein